MSDAVEELKVELTGDGRSFDRVMDRGLRKLDEFTHKVETAGREVQVALDGFGAGAARGMATLDNNLSKLNHGLTPLIGAIERFSDRLAKVENDGEKAGKGTDRASSAVNRLTREYRAGLISQEQYIAKLRETANAAEKGSEVQIAALTRLKRAQEDAAKAAEQAANREKKAAGERAEAGRKIADLSERAARGLTTAVSLPIVGIFTAASRVAIQFEASMRNVNSTLKESEAGFQKLYSDVLGVARDPAITQGPVDLSKALYEIVGSGFKGQQALNVLKASAKGASAGLTDTKVAADALVSILNSGIRGTGKDNPMAAMDILFKTVEVGKGNFEQLAAAIPPVIGTASKMGVTMQEVGAFLATASLQGQSFQDASNDLLNVITKMVRPSKEAQKVFRENNIVWGASRLQATGLADMLDEIQKKLGKNTDALAELFPDMQAFRGVLSGLSNDGKSFTGTLKQMQNATGSTGKALEEQSKSMASEWKKLQKEWEITAAEVGPALIRFLREGLVALRPLIDAVKNAAEAFSRLTPEQQRFTLGLIATAAAVGPMLLGFVKLIGFLGELKGAFAAVKLVMLAVKANGVAWFAAGGPLALAIIAITGFVALLAAEWWKVKTAEDEAAKAAADYANMQARVRKQGRKGALVVRENELVTDIAERQEKIDYLKNGGDALTPGAPTGNIRANQIAELERRQAGDRKALAYIKEQLKLVPDDEKFVEPPKPTPPPKPTETPRPPKPDMPPEKGKTTKQKAAPSFLSHVPLQSFEDLTGKNLGNLPTDAKTYEQKQQAMEAGFAEKRLALQHQASKPGGEAFDEHAFAVNKLRQQLLLADNAIRNTEKAIEDLTGKLPAEEAAYEAANKALNAQIDLINKKRQTGQKVTAEDNKRYAQLREQERTALANLKRDREALEQNQRVHRSAVSDRIRGMEELAGAEKEYLTGRREKYLKDLQQKLAGGQITRAQYEDEIRAAMERIGKDSPDHAGYQDALTESETKRNDMTRDARRKMLRMDGKDFEALREDLKDEIAQMEASGVVQEVIDQYRAKRSAEIDKDEWEKGFRESDEGHRSALADSRESLAEYRAFLLKMLEEAKAKFGEASVEASKLSIAVNKTEWQMASEQASLYREALDQGKISLQEYVVQLLALRSTLPTVSPEYRRMTSEIEAANRKMIEDAKRSADEVGERIGDAVVRVFRGQQTIGQAIKEAINQAIESAIKDFVKRKVSQVIFKGIIQDSGDKMKEAAKKQNDAALNFVGGVTFFSEVVDRFVKAASGMGGGIGGGMGAGIGGGNSLVGNAVNGGLQLSKAGVFGSFGKQLAGAMPYIGLGIGLLSMMGADKWFKSQYRGFETKESQGIYANLGSGDHTGLIDSGYSGTDGMRRLKSQYDARQARSPRTVNHVQIASGAIVVQGAGRNAAEIADEVMRRIGGAAAIDNSLWGES